MTDQPFAYPTTPLQLIGELRRELADLRAEVVGLRTLQANQKRQVDHVAAKGAAIESALRARKLI